MFAAEIRKAVYTMNAIVSLQTISKNQTAFPSEEAAYKLLYLALPSRKNGRCPQDWGRALNQLATLFEDRLTN